MPSRSRSRLVLALAVFVVSAGSVTPSSAAVGKTERASVSSSEAQANGPSPAISVDDRTSPAISLAGQHVATSSDASNLVRGDTNGVADVFVRDLVRGRTSRVSVSSSERQANGPSHSPAISVDGRYVAFVSEATNLVRGDTNGVADIFVRDRKAGTTKRVSVSPSERQANAPSWAPSISLFGRWIGFESDATNLRSDGNGMPDAFYRDMKAGTTVRIAPPDLPQSEPKPNDVAWTARPTISYDGSFIAFQRNAARLVPANTPLPPEVQQIDPRLGRPGLMSRMDVYVMKRKTRKSKRIKLPEWNANIAVPGTPVNGPVSFRQFADNPQLSADGNTVVMDAWSVMDHESGGLNNDLDDDALVRNPVDYKDIWLYDRLHDVDFPVSRSAFGFPGNGDSTKPQITSEGARAIAFVSEASNLTVADTNGAADVFVWDSRERAVGRVSVGVDVKESAGPAGRPSMSYDGRHVAYASSASDLVAGDSNNFSDVFAHDRRIDLRNEAPDLRLTKIPDRARVASINIGQEYSRSLRASDPDGDPLRYGILIVVPPSGIVPTVPVVAPHGSSVDPRTGRFRWIPRADQSGPWTFVFWVEDPRGRADWGVARFVVRTAVQTVDCSVRRC